MRKFILFTAVGLVLCLCGTTIRAQGKSYRPNNGFIPDEKTAIRVGMDVLDAIYGERQIESERPFSAKLERGTWTVTGTFQKAQHFGGVAVIKISKANGCIISVSHGM